MQASFARICFVFGGRMNFQIKMVPGLLMLLAGFLLTVLGQRLPVRSDKVTAVKLFGTGLALAGTVLVFIV